MSAPPQAPLRCSTGIAGLDELLQGGLPVGYLYLVQGDPGTGKTTLALQFLREGVRGGESCLYVTLSESQAELTAVARSHGWGLDGIEVREVSDVAESLGAEAQNTLFHPFEVELQDVAEVIFEAVRRSDPARMVIDSVSELRLLSQSALRYRRQILALKQALARQGCTTLLLDDLTSMDPREDRQLESLSHGVLALRRSEPPYGAERRGLSVRKLRGSDFAGGTHDYAIETGGLVVFPRLLAGGGSTAFRREPIPCGVAGVDQLLGGGLDRGTSTLLLGPAGVGKSTLALTYAHAVARRGENVLLCVFDESPDLYRAKAAALGWDFQDPSEGRRVELRPVDPARLSPGQFTQMVVRAVRQGAARMVVIDSLNGYDRAMQGGEDLNLQLHELLGYLAQCGVTTLLVLSQQGYLDQMHSPVDVTYVADTVVVLRYFEAGGSVRQAISVAKKRSGGHERTIREFQVSAEGVRVGEPLTGFRGVLTGVPDYTGEATAMLPRASEPEGPS